MAGQKSSQRFDLAIIGADTAGLAAAGCAAIDGGAVLVVKSGGEAPASLAGPGVPNAVWRLLGLEDLEMTLAPLTETKIALKSANNSSAERTDAAPSPTTLSVFANDADMTRTLTTRDADAALQWPDFKASLPSLSVSPSRLSDAREANLNGSPISTLNEYLDDYFDDEALKTHIAAQALITVGLAGDEPGSAAALGLLDDGAWPVRASRGGEAFRNALEKAVAKAGVTVVEGGVETLSRVKPNLIEIKLRPGDLYTAKAAMASGVAVAKASGLYPDTGRSPLSRFSGASAFMRIVFDDYPQSPELRDGERTYIIDSREEFAEARDAIAEGRRPEQLPLLVELDHRTITAYTPYCPDQLSDDGELRPWSDQDRKALGRQAYDRIKERFGINERPNAIDVRIDIGPDRNTPDDNAIATPNDVSDPVGAAVALARKIIADE
ncbi:MAG: hypothetical protein AAF224_06110 [Pseudomonadota bacterium]